jgi:ComF family protein
MQPCAGCRVAEPEYDSATCWTSYEAAGRELVRLLKYHRVFPAADYIARRLAERAPDAVDVIIPIPLGRLRRRERGYNQAERVAGRLARYLEIPCRGELLIRTRETAPQSGLSVEQRHENVMGAFRVPARFRMEVAGRRCLLVDDVLTTGSTARACAAALKGAGATSVHLLAAARADLLWARDALVQASLQDSRPATAGQGHLGARHSGAQQVGPEEVGG